MTLRSRLTIYFIIIAVAPLLLAGQVTLYVLGEDMKREIGKRNLYLAKSVADEVSHFVEDPALTLDMIRYTVEERRVRGSNLDQFLADQLKFHSYFKSIMLLDRTGIVRHVFPPNPDYLGIDLSSRPFFPALQKQKKPYWAPVDIHLDSGEPVTTLALPGGGMILVGSLNLMSLKRIVDELDLGPGAYTAIVDQEGTFIAHRDWKMVLERRRIGDTGHEQARLYDDDGSSNRTFIKGEELISMAGVPSTRWTVVVSQPLAEAFAPVKRHQLLMLLWTGLFMVAGVLVSLYLRRRILTPLSRLMGQTKRVTGGDYSQPLAPLSRDSFDEIAEMAESFTHMINSVRSREEAIRTAEQQSRALAEELRISEEKFSRAFRSSPDAISVSVMDTGRILETNDSFETLTGFSHDDVVGSTALELGIWHVPSQRSRFVAELVKSNSVRNFEFDLRTKTGRILQCLVSAERITFAGENCIISTVRDISEIRQLQGQLLHAQKMEAIGHLAGGIAHDFNNYLTAIIGYLSLIQMKMKPDDPLNGYVEKMMATSTKASALTNGLLAFSRKGHLNIKPVLLNEMIRNTQNIIARIVGEDIQINLRLCPEALVVVADAGQFDQVLLNLAANAKDAMPSGGTITISTELVEAADVDASKMQGLRLAGAYALVVFADTGVGIAPEALENIFEPFFTTKETGKGTGLGLSIVYGIVTQHGGAIAVESTPGSGTTIRILLPLAPDGEPAGTDAPAGTQTDLRGTETLLLAEDDADIRKLLDICVRGFGYRVITAADGQEAVELFAQHRDVIDLVVLDVIMPKMNGVQALEEIRKLSPDVQSLFISGYTADILSSKGFADRHYDILFKPVTPATILARVRSILDSRRRGTG